jgi:hypothetical protein
MDKMDRMIKRIFDIACAEPMFDTLDDQNKYQLMGKISMLINIVDEYSSIHEEELLDSEKNLAEVEEQIITIVKSLMNTTTTTTTHTTNTKHDNTTLAQLKYLCSQKMVAYKYSTLYYNSRLFNHS